MCGLAGVILKQKNRNTEALKNVSVSFSKMLTAANIIARNPNILASLKILSLFPANAAIIAPTMMTDEIALVTDISGV